MSRMWGVPLYKPSPSGTERIRDWMPGVCFERHVKHSWDGIGCYIKFINFEQFENFEIQLKFRLNFAK